jgi:hypothetical protein
LAAAVRGERGIAFGILHPAAGRRRRRRHTDLGNRSTGGGESVGSRSVGGGACWRLDGCARVGDIARRGGGVPAFVMVRVPAFAHEILLGSSENGERDEDESECEFHRYRR